MRRSSPSARKARSSRAAAIVNGIEGVVLLDGTWSQAKALWWRNAWMLKCQRVILGPKAPRGTDRSARSRGATGFSTIEAAGMLPRHRKASDIEAALNASFERMLAPYRKVQA